jgi:hypothetical protein
MAGILGAYFDPSPFGGGILGGLRPDYGGNSDADALTPADQSIMAEAARNAWQRRLSKSGRPGAYDYSLEPQNPVDVQDAELRSRLNSSWNGNFAPAAIAPNASPAPDGNLRLGPPRAPLPPNNPPPPSRTALLPNRTEPAGPPLSLLPSTSDGATGAAPSVDTADKRAPPASGIGADLLSSLGQGLRDNSSMLMALGGGMMTGGLGRGFQAAAAASEADSKRQAENASRNATLQALLQAGVPAATAQAAATNPDLLKAIGARAFGQAPDTVKVRRPGGGEALMIWDPAQRRYVPVNGPGGA